MSTIFDRRILVRGAILGTTCAAAWLLLIAPRRAELAELRAIESARRAEIEAGIDQMDTVALQTRKLEVIAYADEFKQLATPLADAGVLQREIRSLADACGVRLTRITPSKLAISNEAAQAAIEGVSGYYVGLTLDVAGPYASVAAFLEQLQTDVGFGKVDSYQIIESAASEGNGHYARAIIRSQHFAVQGDLLAGLDTQEASP